MEKVKVGDALVFQKDNMIVKVLAINEIDNTCLYWVVDKDNNHFNVWKSEVNRLIEPCFIDVNRLLTIPNYAKKVGKTRQLVWSMVKSGQLKWAEISGVKFIKI